MIYATSSMSLIKNVGLTYHRQCQQCKHRKVIDTSGKVYIYSQ